MLKNAGMTPSVWETRNAAATDVDIPAGIQCHVRENSPMSSFYKHLSGTSKKYPKMTQQMKN